jgi:peptide/nickel transport system substrate-binding protein
LKSTLVRQALNYATDRTAIMNAVFGTYGQANDEVSVPGYEGEGYDPAYKNHYTYNIAKAKQLLAEAGYPHGFSMTIGATNLGYGIEVAQAIASEWSQIGVTVKITDYTSILDMVGPWLGKKLPGVAWYWDAQPMFIEAGQLLAQNAGTFNPFVTSNPVLMSLIAKAYATTSPKALGTAWNAVEREVVDLGWEVPVGAGSTLYFASSSLKGVALSPTSFAPDPILWSE